ncbi:MAG: cellulase family glycosylhydrolase [Oscillospiraceae bacterium]|nr:cellulase family glycosylhydrolase [Oscillospiraceae bacterium]
MKNRVMNILLSAFLLLSMTACGGESNNSEDPQSEAVAQDVTSLPASTADYEKKRITVDGTSFKVDGKELWINGVNTPWQNWNDFGGNFDESFWDSHFAELHEAGVNATRVWVNCNGMSIVRLKSDGTVQAVDEQHWTDLDKLFELAEKHDIYIMATLLSFDHFKDGNTGCDKFRLMISDDTATQSYIDSYVIPFVERYGNSPSLWSIDLMNEPDWVHENDECGKVGWEHLSTFFAKCSAAIHENSDELVTVGLGMVKYNSDKFEGNYVSDEFLKSLGGENAYLDFYSPHYYFWQNSYMGYPFEQSPVSFGLDGTKPCVIGEAAVISESGRTPEEDYENAYNNGWNGVMAWTSNGVDNCGSLTELMPAVTKMRDMIKDKIFPLGE